MFDCNNIEEVKLATAGSSSVVAAAKRRGPLAFFIAVIIVTAALLFAMPSLAHASEDAGSGSGASPAQEILLSQAESSTSASKAPDTPSAQPPAYSQQDAFNSASEQSSGVASVSGAVASGDGSYTAGDDKSSLDGKDSDDEADDDSIDKPGYPSGDSVINNNDNTTDDSTAGNSGASSGSSADELATGDSNHQSAQPTGDSKVDDVIATPGDQGSADLTAGAASDNDEEVQAGQEASSVVYGPTAPPEGFVNQYANTTVQPQSTVITPQASTATVYISFASYNSAKYGANGAAASYTIDQIRAATDHQVTGHDTDKIYNSTTLASVGTAGDVIGPVSFASMGKFPSYYRYGYTFTSWTAVYITRNKMVNKNWTTNDNADTTALPTNVGTIVLFANWTPVQFDVKYYQMGDSGSNTAWTSNFAGHVGSVFWDDVLPGTSATDKTTEYVTVTKKPANEIYTNSGENGQWHIMPSGDAQYKAYKFGMTQGNGTEDGLSTGLANFWHYTPGDQCVDGKLTLGELICMYYPQGDTYDGAFFGLQSFVVRPAWNAVADETFKIDFALGSTNTGRGTVTGSQIKVSNDGNSKVTNADLTAANVSATDTNKNDGYVLGSTVKWAWTYTSGATGSGTFNSINDLLNHVVKGNMTLTPVFTQNTYTVTLNGGKATGQTGFTNGTVSPATINYTTSVTLGTPAWTGYTFLGWSKTQQASVGTALAAANKIASGTAFNTISGANEDTTSVTLYAWWEAKKVPIKFSVTQPTGGGTVSNTPSNTSVDYGSSYTIPTTNPSSNGFTFAGWATTANGAVVYSNSGTKVVPASALTDTTNGITLYAKWTEKTGYKVVFNNTNVGNNTTTVHNTQGGTSTSLNWTGNVTLPADPTVPTGYTFDGWYATMGTNGLTVSGSKMTGAMSYKDLLALVNSSATDTTTTINLYAKYTEKGRVSVTLNLNGTGAKYNNSTNNYVASNLLNGSDWTIPATTSIANPTRFGYNFGGWAETSAGGGTIRNAGTTINNITTSITLYAKWVAAPVTITYAQSSTGNLAGVNNASATAADYTATVNYGDTLTVPAGSTRFTRSGYNFANWAFAKGTGTGSVATTGGTLTINSSNINLTEVVASNGTVSYTATIYPNWTAYSYAIAWNTQGGNTIANTTGLQGNSTISLPTGTNAPTRSGYTFKKWVTVVSNPADVPIGTTVGTGSKDVTGGATLSNVFTLPANSGTVTAYAIWEENKVQISFKEDTGKATLKFNDDTAINSTTTYYVGAATGYIYNTATDTVPTPRKLSDGVLINFTDATKYVFVKADGAKWTVSSKGGSEVPSGWVTDNTGKLVVGTNATTKLYETADYYLTLCPKRYNYSIEYYLEKTDGTGYDKQNSPSGTGTWLYGQTLQVGATASETGTVKTVTLSSITGATYNSAVSGTVNSLVMGANNNNVLKVYFDRNKFTVTVNYTGNVPAGVTAPGTATYRYGQTVNIAAAPNVDGYTFSSWSSTGLTTNLSGTGAKNFTMPNNNVTVTGTWGLKTFNVQFQVVTDDSHGTMSGTNEYDLTYGTGLPTNGSTSPVPTVTASNGYYFMGWILYEGCTSKGNHKTSPSYSTTTQGPLFTEDAILGQGAYASTGGWKINSDTVFVAKFGPTFTVTYTAGVSGAFAQQAGAAAASSGTVTTPGTSYAKLNDGAALPGYYYGSATGFSSSTDRNANQPIAAAGYKFVGWSWTIGSDKFENRGSYNAGHNVYTVTSGTPMPTTVKQHLTFTAIWEKTTQELMFMTADAAGTGVVGQNNPSKTGKLGEVITLPTTNAPTNGKPASAYEFKGWTTSTSGTTPLYTTSFTMTAGGYDAAFTLGEGNYGVKLYPVFAEKSVTINYAFANGVTATMAELTKTTETVKMDSGSPAGSTATSKVATGYTFVGWYSQNVPTSFANEAAKTAWLDSNKISAAALFTPAKTDGAYAAATYYAYFEPIKYNITFKVGDHGTWADDTTADKVFNLAYDTTIGTNVPVTKNLTGYGFKYWSDGTNTYSSSEVQNLKVTGNRTFTAMWEERSGYNVAFNTNGGTPGSLSTIQMKWTDVIDGKMTATHKAPQKQGYSFGGWYAKSDLSEASKLATTTTFEQGTTLAGIIVTGDTATITLYAKWNPNNYTVKYDAQWPKTGITTTYADKTNVQWGATGLLPSGASTLTLDGFTFTGWNTKADGSGTAVTDATAFSTVFQANYGSTDYAVKPVTLYAQWDTKKYTVEFQNATGTVLKTESDKNWDSSINYYAYTVADGSQTLLGWKYTPAGGTQQTWASTDGAKLVSALGGDPETLKIVLVADLQNNTSYEINFWKADRDSSGTVNAAGATKVSGATKTGYTTPGVAIDITNFNTHNYIDEFENQNGAGRRPDLKGYVLATDTTGTKTTAEATEVTAGGKVVFNVYFVEKMFDITYDLGMSVIGSKPYAGTSPKPADKQAGWNSTNILPDTNPVWDGYKDPKWQYKDASGSWINVPAGATVKDIANNNDNDRTLTLRALWESDTARLTFAAQAGGSAKSADNSLVVNAGTSKYKDVNATEGPVPTMTATAASGYVFEGWYKDGVLLTADATFTPAKVDGLYSSVTYEARFRALGAITYTIEHYYQNLDGTYNTTADDSATRSGQEFSKITLTNDMKKNKKGFTWKSGITGSIEEIASLVDGKVLKLYYERNEYAVHVQAAQTGADAPDTVPVPTYATTGITQANTTQKFGADLVLPTIDVPSGWEFKWTISYTETGSTATTKVAEQGAPFTMVDGVVDIVGTWKRLTHNVTFTAGDNPQGTVAAKNGKTFPFTVTHGKNLGDAASSGTYADVNVTPNNKWALSCWEYVDGNGDTKTTRDPNSIVINRDTVFKAIWAQTFFVAYNPGAHGGAGFTEQIIAKDEIPADEHKRVNEFPLTIGGTNMAATNYKNVPAAAGYRFVGWTWTLEGTNYYWLAETDYAGTPAGTAGTMDFDVQNNVVFTAIWEAVEQTLTYKLETTAPASQWTPAGRPGQAGLTTEDYVQTPKPRTDEVVTLLGAGDVVREGHVLVGWQVLNADGSKGQKYTNTLKMPAGALTLVPVWEFEGLKIRFEIGSDSTGRGQISKSYVDIRDGNATTIDGASATAKAGYVFDGWYSDPACTNKVDASWLSGFQFIGSRPAAGWVPATYYAKFIPGAGSYTIEYYLQDVNGNYGSAHKTGVFTDIDTEDWADAEDATNNAYTHHLDTTSAQYTGYVFDPQAYGANNAAEVMGDGSTVLKLFYKRIPFEIHYVLDNVNPAGTWVSEVGPNEAIADSTVTIPGVQAENKTHTGWILSWIDATTGQTQTKEIGAAESFTMPNAEVTATPTWVKWVPVIIEYYKDSLDGEMLDRETLGATVEVGQIVTAPIANVNDHRPDGYMNPAPLPTITLVDFEEDEDNPNILRVIYKLINDYVLNFDPNGGTGSQTMTDLTLRDVPADREIVEPTRTGFLLGDMPHRWNTKADGTGAWLTSTSTFAEIAKAFFGDKFDDQKDKVVTLYAIWAENANYKVIYDLNNDPTVNKILYDKVVPSYRNPVKHEDIDVEGVRWTQSGFAGHTDEELDAAPAGFEFAGWNTKADGSGLTITDLTKYSEISDAIEKGAELMSVTLYAMWKEIFIEIEYVTDGGGTVNRTIDRISAATGKHTGTGSSSGDRLTSIATANKGYKFIGWELYDESVHGSIRPMSVGDGVNLWTTDEAGNKILITEPKNAEDRLYGATYIARFALNDDSVIKYDANGGEGTVSSTKMPFGLTGKLSDGKGFTYAHYTLKGWNTAADGSGTAYKLGESIVYPEGGMTLFAQWEENKYDVKVNSRDDEVAKVVGGNIKLTWGEKLPPEFIAAVSQTAKPNSTFKGWRYTMVDADTGETHTGVVQDLSELTVLGPLTVDAEYDTEEPYVSPVPKTGDARDVRGLILIMVLAAAAMIVIAVLARRRNDENEDETEPVTAAVARNERATSENAEVRGTTAGHATRRRAATGRLFRRASARVGGAVCAVALACACAVGVVGVAPGVACAADSSGTTSPNITTSSSSASSDPVTSSTGSFQSNGGNSSGSSSSGSSGQKVASCGPAAAGTTSTGGSKAGYMGTTSTSTGGNAASSSSSAHYGSGSASAPVSTSSSASSTGTAANIRPYTITSGVMAGYTGATVVTSGTKAGFVSIPSRSTTSVRPVAAIVDDNAVAAETGSATYVVPVSARAALLSNLVHSSSRYEVSNASSQYAAVAAASTPGLNVGSVYYGVPRSSAGMKNSTISGGNAGIDMRARNLSALGSMSLQEAESASDSMLFLDSLLNGAIAPASSGDSVPATDSTDALDARSKWMLSLITPGANLLAAACLLDGLAGDLPANTDGTINVYPDLSEARLRDEDMVMGKEGLMPDALGDSLNSGMQVQGIGLLYTNEEGEDGTLTDDASGDVTDEQPGDELEGEEPEEPQTPEEPEEPKGEEPQQPTVPDDPKDEDPVPTPDDPKDEDPGTSTDKKKCHTYRFNYDLNGGVTSTGGDSVQSTTATEGSNDLLASAKTLSKDGYTFLYWSTQPDGTGLNISDGQPLTSKLLHTMVATNELEDEDGANKTLYAQWTNPVSDVVVSDGGSQTPGTTTPPATQVPAFTIGSGSSTTSSSTNSSQSSGGSSYRTTSYATYTPAAERTVTAASFVDAVGDALVAGASNILGAIEALVTTPINALEVAPVATQQLVTMSAEALAGVGTGEGGMGDVDPAEATQVAGAVVAAVVIVGGAAAVTGSIAASAATTAAVNAAVTGASAGAAGAAAADAAAEIAAASALAGASRFRRLRRRHSVRT